jgi:hypothetical protein
LIEDGMMALARWRFADLFATLGHPLPRQERDAYYRRAADVAAQEWKEGRPENFFTACALFGPRLLQESEVLDIVETWWFQKLSAETAEQRRTAGEYLARLGTEFAIRVSGSKSLLLRKLERRAAYEVEKRFCQKFRATEEAVSRQYRRKSEQSRALAEQLNLPQETIAKLKEEGQNLTPTQWAQLRTASRLRIPLETLRATLFPRSSKATAR